MNNQTSLYFEQNQDSKCPVCGGQNFEWGRLASRIYYVPGENLWTYRGYQSIRARRCLQCNNLLSFVDPDLTRKQRQTVMPIIVVAVLFAILAALLPLLLTVLRR